MKARPILFSTPMVQAILDGRKTQTRRVVKPQPMLQGRTEDRVEIYQRGNTDLWEVKDKLSSDGFSILHSLKCPYGQPGDVLWVRETWAYELFPEPHFAFKANAADVYRWRPSIHMPKEAARIWLKITNVRVERLHNITRGDAMQEGCPFPNMADGQDHREWFSVLWKSINGFQSWNDNPWVWVVKFERIEKPANI